MYTPGTLLRLAREERQISLADAKLICRIRETALHAMETDRFDTFPAEYMQTFLPEYANFLGVSHARLAEAFKGTLPEYENLVRSLYSRSIHQLMSNEDEWQQNNASPVQSAARFVRRNARKVVVAAIACCMLWFVFGSGASIIPPTLSAMFAKAIVSTPEDMRGTPFTELNGSQYQSTQPITIDKQKLERLNHRGGNYEVMKRETEVNGTGTNEMRVISLAAIVPLQKEMQSALEDGFEFVMKDEKAEARMRRSTALASVSFGAAKAQLEADAARLSASGFTNTADEEEAEDERSTPETAHEASIEDVRKNADAASARISLILQTRIAGKTDGVSPGMQEQSGTQHGSVIRLKRYVADAQSAQKQIDVVQLQHVKPLQTLEIALPQHFAPVQMPTDLAQFYAGTYDLAQN